MSREISEGGGGGGSDVPRRSYQVVMPATRDMGIGKDGKLPWKLPRELKFFKELIIPSIALFASLLEALNSQLCDAIHITDIDCNTVMPPISSSIFKPWYSSSPVTEDGNICPCRKSFNGMPVGPG
ncbi:hypothetical protein SAY87_003817 [Trapa incisa]|uniref:dihydrofolate reductase n=1 Tax=Trapa incisa TaxID=236973 RepID=A0AAN7QID3_9MYRT|nr:hypothetical protein SAY87_003817 [Trapa incisa]